MLNLAYLALKKLDMFSRKCKRDDCDTVQMVYSQKMYDEICQLQVARYVSASETLWRQLQQIKITDKNPSVVRLDAHLGNYHILYFPEELKNRTTQQAIPETKMTEWFKANIKWLGAAQSNYPDFSCYFTWKKSSKT